MEKLTAAKSHKKFCEKKKMKEMNELGAAVRRLVGR